MPSTLAASRGLITFGGIIRVRTARMVIYIRFYTQWQTGPPPVWLERQRPITTHAGRRVRAAEDSPHRRLFAFLLCGVACYAKLGMLLDFVSLDSNLNLAFILTNRIVNP